MDDFTIEQLIYKAAIEKGKTFYDIDVPEITPENIDDIIINDKYEDLIADGLSEVREGDYKTGLPCEWSRHYESESVASCIDGRWVGWTYWYGGGKHGQPESVPWIDDAYELDCVEQEVLTIKRTFTKKEQDNG